ncbi:uncharacterized protein [Penaeus vannamei]|uniref:uncharacterized protein n=1 Tax=Penaeus vannamei TaxID=6689 RepID=UPI00387F57A8
MRASCLLLLAGVGAWAWAASGGMMVSSPMSCLPVGDEHRAAVASEVVCAVLCDRLRARAYSFADGACEVRGAGLSSQVGPAARRFTRFAPPAWAVRREVSRGKAGNSSTPYSEGGAYQSAIDEDVTFSHFVSHPSTSLPWWMLDLGEQRLVLSVAALPMNYGADAVHDIEIRVGAELPEGENFTEWALLGEYRQRYDPSEGRLVFSSDAGICGRYVAIRKVVVSADLLRLIDVEVYVAEP